MHARGATSLNRLCCRSVVATSASRARGLTWVQGKKLTELMNSGHENVVYFPGVQLPHNLVASSDLEDVVRDADVLVFCAPHQFMRGLVSSLQGKVRCLRQFG